jgi:hypothetical protein
LTRSRMFLPSTSALVMPVMRSYALFTIRVFAVLSVM